MIFLTVQSIADILGGVFVGEESSRFLKVKGAVRDNRDVRPGNLFVCIRGERVDGHDFAGSAFQAGAVCCLAERAIPDATGPYIIVDSTLEAIKILGAYYRSLFDIPVVGITGSVGKTTAKEMVAAVLGEKFHVLKTPENLNNELGVPLTLLSLDEQHEAAVIEMGISDFGEMSRLAEMVRPDIFIITKIGYSHLKELGDLFGVLRAKTEAFSYMKPDGTALLNGDDDLLRDFDPGLKKITYGVNSINDFRVENVRAFGTDAVKCDIESPAGRFMITIPAFGSHLAMAALSAAAAGSLLGMTNEEITRGVLAYSPVGARANVRKKEDITIIDDCYNANPNSVEAALQSLSALDGNRIAILGDMLNLGAQSDLLHSEVGEYAAQCGIEKLICCGNHAKFIFDGFLKAGGKSARHFHSNAELIELLPELIEKRSTVLIKASNSMKFDEIVLKLDESRLAD